jgi:hypothetical protein
MARCLNGSLVIIISKFRFRYVKYRLSDSRSNMICNWAMGNDFSIPVGSFAEPSGVIDMIDRLGFFDSFCYWFDQVGSDCLKILSDIRLRKSSNDVGVSFGIADSGVDDRWWDISRWTLCFLD